MMNSKPQKSDFQLAARRLSFTLPDALPLYFRLDDREYHGIPAEFCPESRRFAVDSNIIITEITGQRKDGLAIRAEILTYRDYPVTEYTVWFTNRGKKDTGILSDIRAVDADFCGSSPVLHHGNGDNRSEDGYRFEDTPVTRDGIRFSPSDDGTSCNGAFPYFRVNFDEFILTCAIGWTGTWQASVTANEMGINLCAGQKYCHFRIRPGETMRTPRILLMTTAGGDPVRAMNQWRHFYFDHILPKQNGKSLPPKLCMHVFNYKGGEFTGATEDSQIYGLEQYVKKGLTPDVWWFDAGFYPQSGSTPPYIGTWREDPVRFPNNGLSGIGKACEAYGTDFMLWFESERSTPGSEIEREHPDFLLTPKEPNCVEGISSLLNLGNPEALRFITDRVDTLIKKWHVHIYRQDFNFDPFTCFREYESEDRLGAVENLHIQGYYRFWDELLFRNPGLVIDSCASGGRRNDLETMRRAVPFQYTDAGCGNHPVKQLQHEMMFEWIPFFRAHTFAWDNDNIVDDFAFFNAFAPAVTYTTPVWSDHEAEFDCARKMVPVWRKAAEIQLRADYLPQMQSTASPSEFFCEAFSDAGHGDGFILFLRNRDCEASAFTAHLDPEPDAVYLFENPLTGEKKTLTAKQLSVGFTETLPEKRSGAVWFFRKK